MSSRRSAVAGLILGAVAFGGPWARSAAAETSPGGGVPPLEVAAVAVTRFAEWAQEMRQAGATDGQWAQGERLALSRRAALKERMLSNPREALELARTLPEEARATLPGSVRRHLEKGVRGRGDDHVAVADRLDPAGCEVHRTVTLGGETFTASGFGVRGGQGSRRDIPLRGMVIDDVIALEEDPPIAEGSPGGPWAGDSGGGTGGGGPLGQSLTQGTRTLLFMPVAFSDDPVVPVTRSAAQRLMSDAGQWISAQSCRSLAIVTDVTPPLVLPETKGFYAVQGVPGLQAAARAAALQAGFDTANYDLDIVCNQILGAPNFDFAGFATVGGKGLILQLPSLDVVLHELGHNFGLWHANFWSAPGDSVTGPGTTVEYGNPFDTMGPRTSSPGLSGFNACLKHQLNWLPPDAVQTVTASGRYRIYALATPDLARDRHYALRLRKDAFRTCWVEFQPQFTANPWCQNGVLLNWAPWSSAAGDSLGGTVLLDTTPGTPTANSSRDDAALVIGRTFSDNAAGFHLTPVARGMTGGDAWIEVQVNTGDFPDNVAPSLELTADQTAVAPGVAVAFTATAADADGDELACDWDFGDLSFGTNALTAAKSWSREGEYVVRCTVSDGKGGTRSRNLTITVGSTGEVSVHGQITGPGGLPVDGVRVHNGQSGALYRGTYSDTDGGYTLTGLSAGSLTLTAVKYGWTFAPDGWANPVAAGADVPARDWAATARAVVRVEAGGAPAAEAGTVPGSFSLTRSGSLSAALSVPLELSGTAIYGTDYTLNPAPASGLPRAVTIPAGQASLGIAVIPLADSLSEGQESAVLTLLESAAFVAGAPAEAVVGIADAQAPVAPVITVSVPDDLAVESAAEAGVFLLSRSGGEDAALSVRYTVTGTASAGIDFTALSGVATLPAGAASVAVIFHAIDDTEVEGEETVVLTVVPDPAYVTGPVASGTATIADDDPARVTLTVTDSTSREHSSDSGEFTVTRIGSLAQSLDVAYSLGGSAVNGVDYVALPGTVTVAAGQSVARIPVTPLDDDLSEGTEDVIMTLLGTPGANITGPGEAVLFLTDDDSPGVTLTASASAASEAGSNPGAFQFTRTGSTAGPLEVHFTLSGSAREGVDFAAVGGSVEIPAGSASAILTIDPVDDTLRESSETVVLALAESPEARYSVTTTSPKTVTIADNDSAALVGVGFSTAASSGPESQFLAAVTITLSAPSPVPVLVNCVIAGGTAVNGVDFGTDLPKTVFFPAGLVSQSLNAVAIYNNSNLQADRTVVLALQSPVNAQVDVPATHTYTIRDDDASGGAVTVTALVPTARESGGEPAKFRISRSGGTVNDLAVNFQVTGTASSPSDFLPVGHSLVIPAGADHFDLDVTPVDDATPEGVESVRISLTSAADAVVGTPSRATVSLIDNDLPPVLAPEPDVTAGSSNEITWTCPEGAEQTEVQRSPGADFADGTTESSGWIPGTSWVFTGLQDGVRYYYRARAWRVEATPPEGMWSSVVSSTQDASPPVLTVAPVPAVTGMADLTLSGTAGDVTSGVAAVTINGVPADSTDGFATWSARLVLQPGANVFLVEARDRAEPAHTASAELTVYLAAGSLDADEDGLPDGWEFASGLDLFDDGSVSPDNGPLGNSDRDEMTNLVEFALGRDPRQPDAVPMWSEIVPDPVDGKSYVVVTFVRRIAAPGIGISLDLSQDTQHWEPGTAGNTEVVSTVADADGLTETVKLRVLPAVDEPGVVRWFSRLRVTVNPGAAAQP